MENTRPPAIRGTLVGMKDPWSDCARVKDLLATVRQFVDEGPYLHEDTNVCWFCQQGIVPFLVKDGVDVECAGHHRECEYLQAWKMVYGKPAAVFHLLAMLQPSEKRQVGLMIAHAAKEEREEKPVWREQK